MNDATESFQYRVRLWLLSYIGPMTAAHKPERNFRFFEEALELVQSLGMTADECCRLVDYTFGRPWGEPKQEAGGVLMTLAALCQANDLDVNDRPLKGTACRITPASPC